MVYSGLFMTHIFACIFHFIGMTIRDNHYYQINWLDAKGIGSEDVYIRYVYAFYFSAVTTMTVGYGDITSTNPIETLFTIIFVFIGCGTFAYFINKMGLIL
jgi:hypothetical protein